MKLKIISDGTPYGTQVVDAETNEPIKNLHVTKITWEMDATDWTDAQCICELTVADVPAELTGNMKLVLTHDGRSARPKLFGGV